MGRSSVCPFLGRFRMTGSAETVIHYQRQRSDGKMVTVCYHTHALLSIRYLAQAKREKYGGNRRGPDNLNKADRTLLASSPCHLYITLAPNISYPYCSAHTAPVEIQSQVRSNTYAATTSGISVSTTAVPYLGSRPREISGCKRTSPSRLPLLHPDSCYCSALSLLSSHW